MSETHWATKQISFPLHMRGNRERQTIALGSASLFWQQPTFSSWQGSSGVQNYRRDQIPWTQTTFDYYKGAWHPSSLLPQWTGFILSAHTLPWAKVKQTLISRRTKVGSGRIHESPSVLVYLHSCSQLGEDVTVLYLCSLLKPGERSMDGKFSFFIF